MRDINRRILLNLVRTRQPISRADLARYSGLQRSTVSAIVEDLAERKWILEGPTGRLPRGRRPTFLQLNDKRAIVGIDVRPTQTAIALANVNGKFGSHQVFQTPSDPDDALAAILKALGPVIEAADGMVEGIGMTLPGRVDPATGCLAFAPNLGWKNWDPGGPIAAATGLEVMLENAANACALAAVWFDRAGESKDLVLVTVSEGIGTGILINGQLTRGFGGMAGEFGHVPLEMDGPLCTCGGRGCWEVFASNRAALRYYGEWNPEGQDPSFPELLARADQGDERAAAALDKMAHYLGRGMRMVVAGLAPERIVVIGDLTRAWRRFGPVIEAEVRAQALPGGPAPSVTPAHEDGMARLRGTVALVLQKHFGAPPA